MKTKYITLSTLFIIPLILNAQWTQGTGKITTTNNVGIGTTTPEAKLDVNGIIRSRGLSLLQKEAAMEWRNTFIEYPGHSLVIGSPYNVYGHNVVEIKPGGSVKGAMFSALDLYQTNSPDNQIKKVRIISQGKSFFNGGNVGIGTETPQTALDVNGTIQSKGLSLIQRETIEGSRKTYIEYPGHSLIIGTPIDTYGHNTVEIKPGGSVKGAMFSALDLYQTNSPDNQIKRVRIISQGKSFFNGGNVGIGTENPDALLTVAGLVKAREVKIEVTAGADHVFNSDYDLKPLSEVETFVKENRHLPEIPSEKQMLEDGLSVNEFQIKLLQKIEELTLYVIEQDKKNQTLESEVQSLRLQIENNPLK